MSELQNNDKWAKGRLYFLVKQYPIFGRGIYSDKSAPASVTNSPFFWWFMFLRLNDRYHTTFKNNGIGPCADLYKDFGDIYSYNFKEWWLKQGHAKFFAEKSSRYIMQIASSARDVAPFNDDQVLNLIVPLSWSQTALKKRFAELVLSKVDKLARGVRVEGSSADYKLSGKWHIDAIKTAYTIYTLRQKNGSFKEFTSKTKKTVRYELNWADLAIRAGLKGSENMKEGVKGQVVSDERRILTILAKRHYKRALKYIDAAATKQFP